MMNDDLHLQAQKLAARHYAIAVARDETTDGDPIFVAYNPELPGCLTQGDTAEEALSNLTDARIGYIEGLLEYNLPVPEPLQFSTMSAVKRDSISLSYTLAQSRSTKTEIVRQEETSSKESLLPNVIPVLNEGLEDNPREQSITAIPL